MEGLTMTHLRIEQSNNIEIVNATIIQKLYNIALDIEENLDEGETLSDYVLLKGNLQVDHAYQSAIAYLNNKTKFPNLQINIPTGAEYVEFTDPEVEKALALDIGDGVGVTNYQISNITTADGGINFKHIKNNTNITNFVEFMNFSQVTRICGALFYGCTNLNVIGLPGNVIYFDRDSFTDPFQSLKKIVFKDTITNYLRSTFDPINSSPTGFDLTGNKLTDLCINSEDNVIYHINYPTDGTACLNNTSIKSITYEDGCTSIPGNTVEMCPNLEKVIIPESVTDLGGANFYGCPKLKFLDIPSNINTIPNYAIGGSTYLTAVILRSTTPPTIAGNSNLLYSGKVYVPDESVNTYKQQWTSYQQKIYPISQFAIDYPDQLTEP